VHLHFEYWRSGGESAAVDPEDLIMRVCRVGKDGTSAGSAVEPAPEPKPEPAPAPAPERAAEPVDDAIVGEVFSN
jgi:hypothetical protein